MGDTNVSLPLTTLGSGLTVESLHSDRHLISLVNVLSVLWKAKSNRFVSLYKLSFMKSSSDDYKVDVGMFSCISYNHYNLCFGAFYYCNPYFIIDLDFNQSMAVLKIHVSPRMYRYKWHFTEGLMPFISVHS